MFKKILKAGALFFAVGVALALVAPPLATFLGAGLLGEAAVAHAVATPVLWTGAFFGAFGAIDTALRPVFDKIFGDDKKPEVAAVQVAAPKVAPALAMQPAQDVAVEPKFRQTVEAERLAVTTERSSGV